MAMKTYGESLGYCSMRVKLGSASLSSWPVKYSSLPLSSHFLSGVLNFNSTRDLTNIAKPTSHRHESPPMFVAYSLGPRHHPARSSRK